jgi:hypothetical protein
MNEEPTKAARSGTVLALVGGAMLAVGSLLTWANTATAMPGAGEESHAISGMDASTGTITLAAGLLVLAVALVSLFWRRGGGLGLGAAVIELAAGGFGSVLGILYFTDLETNALNTVISESGLDPKNFGEAGMKILADASAVTAGWGLYLVILGGMVAFIGGVLTAIDLRATMMAKAALLDDDVAEEGDDEEPEDVADGTPTV